MLRMMMVMVIIRLLFESVPRLVLNRIRRLAKHRAGTAIKPHGYSHSYSHGLSRASVLPPTHTSDVLQPRESSQRHARATSHASH